MKALIYVEGPSDKAAMETLLRPLIREKEEKGVQIRFIEAPRGDKKESVLLKVPKKAANILLHDRDAIVVAMPDLHPKNKGFPHRNVEELQAGVIERFRSSLKSKLSKTGGLPAALASRFQVFCFKYDLEALVLAAEENLARRLKVRRLKRTWRLPVEEQNDDDPPKKIVERLFAANDATYRGTVDAPSILQGCDYRQLAELCPQCFGPFVEFLEGL